MSPMSVNRLRGLALLPLLAILAGCKAVLLNPPGDVARQQSDVMITSVVLISLIIVPVLVAIGVIAWRYRASNRKARYQPDWEHSSQLELVVWAAPLLIIIALGAVTWIGTHQLDPYRPLSRVDDGSLINYKARALEIEVVSLDWKWLFFYPQYGIATVNDVAAPVKVPIHFKLTSSRMMNSFFVPALVGQIYTMAGMQTELHAAIEKPGVYKGFSANYSGLGYTDMRFTFRALSRKGFEKWIAKARASGHVLSLPAYRKLVEPSRNVPAEYFSTYASGLYHRILNMCTLPGQVCMDKMMAADARRNQWGPEASKKSQARSVSTEPQSQTRESSAH